MDGRTDGDAGDRSWQMPTPPPTLLLLLLLQMWDAMVLRSRLVGRHREYSKGYRTLRPQDTSASRHSGTLRHRSQDTSTRVPWSRKSRDTSTQDNSDETQLHRWFGLNFGTNQIKSNQIKIYIAPYVHADSEALGGWITCGRRVGIDEFFNVFLKDSKLKDSKFCGAEVSRCRSILWPKCPAPILKSGPIALCSFTDFYSVSEKIPLTTQFTSYAQNVRHRPKRTLSGRT